MSKFHIFARLAKYDEETGVFEAIAADQAIDKSGERFHYKSSKPYFEKWSTDISKATDGKSVGNVRSMHGKNAAGKLTDLTCDDAESAIKVRGKIIDPVDKAKMSEGVYTGVSIGGEYITKWADDENPGINWYTANPAEISVVDNPCGTNNHFTYVKADGTQELRKFHVVDVPITEVVDVSKSAAAGEGESPAPPATTTDSRPPAAAASATDGEAPKPAVTEPSDAVKAHAARLAKHEPAHRMLDTVRAAYGLPAVEKGMYDVSSLASLIGNLAYIAESAESEAAWEGDNSAVPAELRASVKQLGAILISMAAEEVSEAAGDEVMVIELAAKIDELHKRGAKYSSATMKSLQTIHDTVAKMTSDGVCPKAEKVEGAPMSKVAKSVLDETAGALAKARTDLATANESLAKATARVTELEALPAAGAPRLRVVGKGEDIAIDGAAPDVAPVMVAGKVDTVATSIKKMLTAGHMAK